MTLKRKAPSNVPDTFQVFHQCLLKVKQMGGSTIANHVFLSVETALLHSSMSQSPTPAKEYPENILASGQQPTQHSNGGESISPSFESLFSFSFIILSFILTFLLSACWIWGTIQPELSPPVLSYSLCMN